jgi:hypothetical protein
LVDSQPPSCIFHIQDIDEWFESLERKLSTIADLDESHNLLILISHDIYKQSFFHRKPFFKELYYDYKKKIDPEDECQFSFTDIIYFCLYTAASGIIGNFAYDAIKRLVHKINKEEKLDEGFEGIVNPEKYDELRKIRNPRSGPKIDIDVEFEIDIKRKYRILLRKR